MKTGTYLSLSDFQSMLSTKKATGVLAPKRLEVERLGSIFAELCTLRIAYMVTGEVLTTLMFDGRTEHILWNIDPEFPAANRTNLINTNNEWLFQEPQGDYTVDDLVFTESILDDSTNPETNYIKDQSVIGPYFETPAREGLKDLFGGFTKYVAKNAQNERIYLALIEIGSIVSSDGGFINLYKGYEVSDNEIKEI